MNVVAEECKVKKHHPEWSNVYNTTFIRWTTHSPPGLSAKDIEMAQFCDEQALVFGELVPESQEEEVLEGQDVGKELADRVAVEGGDCCVPKPRSKA
jgi:4a-hydroxytetrahydrobiopterin dehydratase